MSAQNGRQVGSDRKVGSTGRYRLIDLFSGAGGLSLGFSQAFPIDYHPAHHRPCDPTLSRFRSVWANDADADASATYTANFGSHCLSEPLETVLAEEEIPPADVVIGGPPCQGFSLLNRNRAVDERRALWRPFMEVVERCEASVFVIENVRHLLRTEEHAAILGEARRQGFLTAEEKLLAADYGVPQLRWRAFIIGCKFADPASVFPPSKTHFDIPADELNLPLEGETSGRRRWRWVEDWLDDLPLKPAGNVIGVEPPPLDLHVGRFLSDLSLRRYRTIPDEGMNRFDLQRLAPELTPPCWLKKERGGTDLFGRMWWKRPAHTIRTEFFKPEKGRYIHPSEHRPLTHREAARLQGFPDWFRFVGSKLSVARQIGNAVPPPLAARIADCVYALLAGRSPRAAEGESARG